MTATDTASTHSTGSTAQSVEAAVTDLIRVFKLPAMQRRLMEDAGVAIEYGAYWALGRIGTLGSCRPSELAASLGVDASTITHRIHSLERGGFVERSTDPTDGRACNVHLSEAGAAALARLREARRALFDQMLAGWSPDEQSRFAAAAERLRIALEGEIREP
jgi:DNA-binding MarR family transcriptional regulator